MTLELAPILAGLYGWPLIIMALAVYSITRLITKDSIVDRQRDWFIERFPYEGYTTRNRPNPKRCEFIVTGDHYYVTVGNRWGELVTCPWCMGFWVSVAVFGAFCFWPIATTFVLVPWALRVVPGMIESALS